jgi:ribonuclease P protein component
VLSKSARLTESSDFARTTKSGHRVATEFFVGYLYLTGTNESPKAGLIISKSVGGSVLRHRIARKARHAIAENISALPEGALLVLRAIGKAEKAQTNKEISEIVTRLVKKSNQAAAQ